MGLVGMVSVTCTFFLYDTEIVRRRRNMFKVVLQLATKSRTGTGPIYHFQNRPGLLLNSLSGTGPRPISDIFLLNTIILNTNGCALF